ncbi:MAG TPA: FmdB family zinc ribbon protein [Pseudonocardiaceae bacterium]|nr:FmdB family zinc ribbon protein [Pseudonocardiaceae bacterium]
MPTYQYACTACGHRFEAVQSFTDASLSECPECSGKLRKLFGAVGVVFKGSGFYRNDSRAEGKPSPTGAKAESKSGEAKSTESKSSDSSSSAKPAATSTSSSGSSSAGSSSSGSSSSGKAAAAS